MCVRVGVKIGVSFLGVCAWCEFFGCVCVCTQYVCVKGYVCVFERWVCVCSFFCVHVYIYVMYV